MGGKCCLPGYHGRNNSDQDRRQIHCPLYDFFGLSFSELRTDSGKL